MEKLDKIQSREIFYPSLLYFYSCHVFPCYVPYRLKDIGWLKRQPVGKGKDGKSCIDWLMTINAKKTINAAFKVRKKLKDIQVRKFKLNICNGFLVEKHFSTWQIGWGLQLFRIHKQQPHKAVFNQLSSIGLTSGGLCIESPGWMQGKQNWFLENFQKNRTDQPTENTGFLFF